MSKVYNKGTSKLIKGLDKVIARQNNKPKDVTIQIDFNTFKIYKNKYCSELGKLNEFYFPLSWKPLKYVIKPVAHTYYTYTISSLPMAKERVRQMKRKKAKKAALQLI